MQVFLEILISCWYSYLNFREVLGNSFRLMATDLDIEC